MVQYNSYSVGGGSQQVVSLDFEVRKIDFEVHGGNGGGGKFSDGGNGGFVSGTYTYSKNDQKFFIAYPGENGDSKGGGDGVVAQSPFANGGAGAGGGSGDGGAMSAIGVENILAVAGGGGGAGDNDSIDYPYGGGGGGSPGGSGGSGTSDSDSNGTDGETTSISFAQGLGGNGGDVADESAGDASAAGNSSYASNISTGVGGGGYVSVTSYGPPDKITSLTTSINSNYHPTLSWNAANNGITQRIYRKERTQNSYSQVGTTSDSAGTFVDTSTLPNTTYSYKIVQNDNYFQDGSPSIIHTPDERVQVYRNGSWEPATLETY